MVASELSAPRGEQAAGELAKASLGEQVGGELARRAWESSARGAGGRRVGEASLGELREASRRVSWRGELARAQQRQGVCVGEGGEWGGLTAVWEGGGDGAGHHSRGFQPQGSAAGERGGARRGARSSSSTSGMGSHAIRDRVRHKSSPRGAHPPRTRAAPRPDRASSALSLVRNAPPSRDLLRSALPASYAVYTEARSRHRSGPRSSPRTRPPSVVGQRAATGEPTRFQPIQVSLAAATCSSSYPESSNASESGRR